MPETLTLTGFSPQKAVKNPKPVVSAGKIVDLLITSGHALQTFSLKLQWVGP
jgi:hypothetical protein